MALSMKQLDERLIVLEEAVAAQAIAIKAIQEEYTYPKQYAGAAVTQEDMQDLRVATINALYNQRSQGANNMAKALEAKYFDGADVREIGDEFVTPSTLWSATKSQGEGE